MYDYNGLKVSCDWMEFTIQESSPYKVLEEFGFTAESFKNMERGSLGYSKMLRHKSAEVTVLYDGNTDMGVHVQVKGSAISCFLEEFKQTLKVRNAWDEECYEYEDFNDIDNITRLILKKVRGVGWFSRLDLAVDDIGVNYYSCKRVHKMIENKEYVSKVKRWNADVPHNRAGEIIGYTVYLGSPRNSRMFLRVYDKKLEQKKEDLPDWVRWEVVLKDERADNFADYVINGMDFSVATASTLNTLVRFVNKTSCNKSLCETKKKWKKFVGSVGKLKLTASLPRKSVERSCDWINRQCAPTIAGLVAAFGGDMSFLTGNLSEHFERLSVKDKEMFLNYLKEGVSDDDDRGLY